MVLDFEIFIKISSLRNRERDSYRYIIQSLEVLFDSTFIKKVARPVSASSCVTKRQESLKGFS